MPVTKTIAQHLLRTAWIVLLAAGLAAIAGCATTTPTTTPPADDAIIVSPTGDDATADGTAANPFRTLTAAVQSASAGDTIRLLAGLYTDDGGDESFPIDISGLTVEGEGEATTTIRGTQAAGNFGLEAFDGTTVLRDVTIENHGDTAVWASGTSHAFTMERVTVRNTDYDAVEIRQSAVATLRNVTITSNAGNNVYVREQANLTIEDSTLEAAAQDGINIGDTATVTVRGTSIVDNTSAGVRVFGIDNQVDLGTGADAGGNTITGNSTYGLDDQRSDGAANTITAYGNTWDAAVSGVKTGPDASAPVYSIIGTGNEVDFGP